MNKLTKMELATIDSNECDISHETQREYNFNGHIVRILDPISIAIDDCGIHFIEDNEHLSHIIPTGWKHLVISRKNTNEPAFYYQRVTIDWMKELEKEANDKLDDLHSKSK